MANIAFTRNYTDHSNQQGYQFEFHCDKCGNGFRSTYAASTLGMAAGALHAAADIFGGILGSAANAGDHLKDALRGKAWDSAFADAIAEIKPKFKQCTRCSKWVCPEVCWNGPASLCKGCAPDLGEETAAAQAEALKQSIAEQITKKVQGLDLTASMNMGRQAAAVCPSCSAPATGGKFCGSCGKPMAPAPSACPQCKAEIPAAAKFCPECGTPRG